MSSNGTPDGGGNPSTKVKESINLHAQRLAAHLPDKESTLEVVEWALILALSIVGDPSVERPRISTESFGDEVCPADVIRVAEALREDQVRFTLDELIDSLGVDGMVGRTFKNSLTRILRAAGYRPRQVRLNGARPIIWERFESE